MGAPEYAPDWVRMLTTEQCRRALSLQIALELLRGRSVPIQVVERLALWINTGAREP